MSIFRPPYLQLSLGCLLAIFAAAFDQTSVTAVMPKITELLGGQQAYSTAFVAERAAAVFGMVAAGLLCDRTGVRKAIYYSGFLFAAGLLLAIVAPNLIVFLSSRAVQGAGGGAAIVAIYAAINQLYPPDLRTNIFAAFAAAWVIPSLLGPGLAGLITVYLSWHGVFAFALAAMLAAMAMIHRPLNTAAATAPLNPNPSPGSSTATFIFATVLATGLVAANLAAYLPQLLITLTVFAGGTLAMWWGLKHLTPAGTFTARPELGRMVATRGLLDAALAAEMWLPLLFAQKYQLAPTQTGLALTASGLAWFFGSAAQTKLPSKNLHQAIMLTAVVMLLSQIAIVAAVMAGLNWLLIIAAWGLCALAMGYVYPLLSAKTLAAAPATEVGFVSAAIQLTGAAAIAFTLAGGGIIQNKLAQWPHFYALLFGLFPLTMLLVLLVWQRRPATAAAPAAR